MTTVRDAARELLVSSLTLRARELRAAESRARRAYSQPGPLRDAAQRLAGVYERAAEVFEQELGQIEFVDGTTPDPDPQTRPALDLDAMNRGRAAVGMPPLDALPGPPPAELIAVLPPPDPETETATCWSGAKVYCKNCGGKTEAGDDEYGSLAQGGSYEQFSCVDCGATTYVELPD